MEKSKHRTGTVKHWVTVLLWQKEKGTGVIHTLGGKTVLVGEEDASKVQNVQENHKEWLQNIVSMLSLQQKKSGKLRTWAHNTPCNMRKMQASGLFLTIIAQWVQIKRRGNNVSTNALLHAAKGNMPVQKGTENFAKEIINRPPRHAQNRTHRANWPTPYMTRGALTTWGLHAEDWSQGGSWLMTPAACSSETNDDSVGYQSLSGRAKLYWLESMNLDFTLMSFGPFNTLMRTLLCQWDFPEAEAMPAFHSNYAQFNIVKSLQDMFLLLKTHYYAPGRPDSRCLSTPIEVQQLQYFSVVYLQEGIDRLNPGSILGPRDQFPLPEQVLIMNECRGSWGQYTGIKIEKLQTNVKGTIVHAFKPNSTQFSPSPLTLTYRLVVGQGTGTEQCVLKVEVLRSCNFADISHVNWGKTEGKIEAKTSIPAPSRGPTILMTAQIWTMVLKDCKPAGPKSRSRNLRTDLGNGSEALKGLQDKEPGDIITVSKVGVVSEFP
ncbi:hypothetical protein B0H16DRAFT_1484657 [Mycena metata]|uniref:Uncharacterized protein n=1 Tax=Mycena metata TaxID=1033252 RepID=A0AAD7DSE5_9AGAR|nr:hypothetical protein B0H16DRAFT_1484657 [Mycena metata]